MNTIHSNFVGGVNVILRRVDLLRHGVIKDMLIVEMYSFRKLAMAVAVVRCQLLLLEGHLNLDLL